MATTYDLTAVADEIHRLRERRSLLDSLLRVMQKDCFTEDEKLMIDGMHKGCAETLRDKESFLQSSKECRSTAVDKCGRDLAERRDILNKMFDTHHDVEVMSVFAAQQALLQQVVDESNSS